MRKGNNNMDEADFDSRDQTSLAGKIRTSYSKGEARHENDVKLQETSVINSFIYLVSTREAK